MSRLLEVREICERSLRRIGSYAIRSSGPRPEEMEEARYWLDMVVGHVAARQRAFWLVPATGVFTLVPGQATYDIGVALGPTQAANGVQFVISAYLFDVQQDQEVQEISLLRRHEYEEIDDKDRQGEPCHAYVDRTSTPKITLHPVPDANRVRSLRVLFQSFATDLTKNMARDQTYQFRASWNLYLVTALAAQLANGPVRKAPADEVKDMKDEAKQLAVRPRGIRRPGAGQRTAPRPVLRRDLRACPARAPAPTWPTSPW